MTAVEFTLAQKRNKIEALDYRFADRRRSPGKIKSIFSLKIYGGMLQTETKMKAVWGTRILLEIKLGA